MVSAGYVLDSREFISTDTFKFHNICKLSAAQMRFPEIALSSKLVITVLSVALVSSNTWWAIKTFDSGISSTYLRASYETVDEQFQQIKAVAQVLTKPSAAKVDVISAASRSAKTTTPYEKLGYTWVGQIGLKFNSQGNLVHIITSEDEAR